ncbi:hypothetical protein [Alicyclobacillus fodiniaquatilis]|uniref:Uncharacterized protein n=1 Tax=Alicyclobacillus fodiniaquatilis TaxID=1661150 RepID=A0ABW4JJU7_9BACL
MRKIAGSLSLLATLALFTPVAMAQTNVKPMPVHNTVLASAQKSNAIQMSGYVHDGQYNFISNSTASLTITPGTSSGEIDVSGTLSYSGGQYSFSGTATADSNGTYQGNTDISVNGQQTTLLFNITSDQKYMSAEFNQTVFVESTTGASFSTGQQKYKQFKSQVSLQSSVQPMSSTSNPNVDAQYSTGSGGTFQEVIGPKTLARNSSQLYTFRDWLDDSTYDNYTSGSYYDYYYVVEGQWFGNTYDPNNQVYETEVYPNPPHSSTSSYTFSLSYAGVGLSYTSNTTKNTYTANGTNWWIDQFYPNNDFAQDNIYSSDSKANGIIASVNLYAGENATLGTQEEKSEQCISIENQSYGDNTDYFWLYNTTNFPVDIVS